MRNLLLLLTVLLFLPLTLIGQPESNGGLIKLSHQGSEASSDLQDILDFKKIAYKKITLMGRGIKGKKYQITAIDIWNGKIQDTTTIVNSTELPYVSLQTISSDTLQIKIIAEHTDDNKLKVMFRFPGFSTTKEFDAVDSEFYSLRNANLKPITNINPGEIFYIFNYILPYEENGTMQYCTVAQSGDDVLNWGKKFDLDHYLVFSMALE